MILKNVDDAGRIIIPKRIRDNLNMNKGDSIEIFADGENIIFQKYVDTCSFCGSDHDVKDLKKVCYCRECSQNLPK